MIIYEVTIHIKKDIFAHYYSWLKDHINIMLGFSGFLKADVYEVLEPLQKGYQTLCVSYCLKNIECYKNYVNEHAHNMRKEALEEFRDQLVIERRVLVSMDVFSN